MASFKAVHPLVRETAYKYGFVPDGSVRVKHTHLHGKKAQFAFFRAFKEASELPGVRRVKIPGAMGNTLLFPEVSDARWEAARNGAPWDGDDVAPIVDVPVRQVKLVRESKVEADKVSKPYQANMTFSGTTNELGAIVDFQVHTTSNDTARAILRATLNR